MRKIQFAICSQGFESFEMVYQDILNEFDEGLVEVKIDASNPMQETMAGIEICNDFLERFQTAVTKHGFESIEEEIHFFKNLKSGPLSYLIYFTEVRSCEMQLPKWNLQAKLAHIEGETIKINSFFDQNLDFRFYMENGNGEKDEMYFSRKYLKESPISISSPYFRNSSFNTSHDELWAMLKGFEMYGNYLSSIKSELETAPNEVSEPMDKNSPYRFTKPATAAMELIYALKLAGFINHGDFEIKAFVEFFSKTFGLAIKDPYGLFKQITQRKSDRTKYLRMLMDALLAELEKRDEYIQ